MGLNSGFKGLNNSVRMSRPTGLET